MPELSAEDRAQALISSPAGCVLLLIAEEHNLSPADLANSQIGLFAIADAVGAISPWMGTRDLVVAEALRNGPRLRARALELVSTPGISWWWAPIDREAQLWLPQHDEFICPEEVWDLRPSSPPNTFERYVHAPRPQISTSEMRGGLSSELAFVISVGGDWTLEFPIHPRKVRIRRNARVIEINSAQDWHDLVRTYPADGAHATHPDMKNTPWGESDGMVPNWSRVVRDWDGVHITPWAVLTASQVRVTSDIGWSEPWAWDGAHTIWLNWMFDSVVDLPPIEEETFEVPHYWIPRLQFPEPSEGYRKHSWSLPIEPAPEGGSGIAVSREPFGEVGGHLVEKFTLSNRNGMSVSILTHGGIIQSLTVPDRNGKLENVVLGFDNLAGYRTVARTSYLGAIVGRYANRIANGQFSLDGADYSLAVNNGPNSLHGGEEGFDRRVWRATFDSNPATAGLVLHRLSPDGEEGYPGAVDVTVTYHLAETNSLTITYTATSDAPTVINLTNHAYFNLAGGGSGSILRHALQLNASHYTPVNAALIPTGEIAPVSGTPFDFTEARIIGDRIGASHPQLVIAGGYDHNLVVDRPAELPRGEAVHVARVIDPGSGRVLDVLSDQPGVQFYTGNFLDGAFAGSSGAVYHKHAGFCLETQHFPDSPNQPEFPSTVLQPGGERFRSQTTFTFGMLP